MLSFKTDYLRYFLGFILLFLIFLCFRNDLLLFFFSSFFICISLFEYCNMFNKCNIHIHKVFAGIAGCFLAYIFVYRAADFCEILVPSILACFIVPFLLTILENKKPYIKTSLCTICFIFFVLCGLFIIKLKNITPDSFNILLIYFCSVLLGDYSASIIGPKVKKKIFIAKEISPKKTLAGSLAHIASSCCVFMLGTSFIELTLLKGLFLGVLISIFAQFGDLTISCIKRELNIKHSSTLFSEYGGIFDRIDAFIFSAPVAYYFF